MEIKRRAVAAIHSAARYSAYAFELVLVVVALLAIVVTTIAIVAIRAVARALDHDVVDTTMRELFALALGPFVPEIMDSVVPASAAANADGSIEVPVVQPEAPQPAATDVAQQPA